MDFGFSEEQDQLRQEVRRFLDERCPLSEVRRIMETPSGSSEELWREMAELGWLGLTVPEAYGGAGLGWVDLVILLEETGRSLYPSPLISNTLAVTAILEVGSDEQKQRWLPGLVDGSRIGSLALLEEGDGIDPAETRLSAVADGEDFLLSGQKRLVTDPDAAGVFVVSFRCSDAPKDLGLAVIDADSPGVEAKSFPMIDATKRMGHLDLDGVRVGRDRLLGSPGSAGPAITRLIDQGAVAVTSEMVGAVEEAIRITVQYANDRIQFGSPIGRFQAVKHPLAEMHVDLESFKSLLYYAAWAVASEPESLSRSASLAKAYATEAFVRTGLDSISLHGAVGFTVESDIQLYFKRSKWARPMFGDAAAHYERALALRGV